MLEAGQMISRDLQLWITVLTLCIMVGGLLPKPWRKQRDAANTRRLAESRRRSNGSR